MGNGKSNDEERMRARKSAAYLHNQPCDRHGCTTHLREVRWVWLGVGGVSGGLWEWGGFGGFVGCVVCSVCVVVVVVFGTVLVPVNVHNTHVNAKQFRINSTRAEHLRVTLLAFPPTPSSTPN